MTVSSQRFRSRYNNGAIHASAAALIVRYPLLQKKNRFHDEIENLSSGIGRARWLKPACEHEQVDAPVLAIAFGAA
jgi:hypothetical protein